MPDLSSMRVGRWMSNDTVGRWRIKRFSVTTEQRRIAELKIRTNERPERLAMALKRVIPPGDYVSLQRRMIETEVQDTLYENVGDISRLASATGQTPEQLTNRLLPMESRWMPVMSDTPAELEGHATALSFHGNVLVTGLGLGCVIAGLLAIPDVARIDVIEIDPDVIRLTGPYYTDERIHIWAASATNTAALPADLSWNFAWHDIWTHVAERNLSDETAEHGISYDRLFSTWESRVSEQHAWAYEDALEMRAINERARAANIDWYDRLLAADEETQIRMLQDKVILESNPDLNGKLDDGVRELFDPGGAFRAHLRGQLRHNPTFLSGMREVAHQDLNSTEPLGRPNEEQPQ